MNAVDVLIVGGGIQGLVLLNELVRHGYACILVTNADLGAGQSLHSHGVLNSGYLFPSKHLRASVSRDWLPFAQAHGVQLYGHNDWYIVPPPTIYEQLRPCWDDGGYEYAEATTPLPPGFSCDPDLPVLKVKEYNFPKRQMVRALCSGLSDHILRGDIVRFGCTPTDIAGTDRAAENRLKVASVTLWLHATGEQVAVSPKALISAAGTGTRRLFESLMADESFAASAAQIACSINDHQAYIVNQLDKVTYRRTHMLCIRAPRHVLPAVSVMLIPQGLFIAGHLNTDHDRVSQDGSDYSSWYVTPLEQNPLRHRHAPDNAHAEPSPEVVVHGFNSLVKVFPELMKAVDRPWSHVEFAVFAGYKQDIGEHPGMPVCEPVDGLSNVILALPSVTTNAWINARAATALLDQWMIGNGPTAAVPGSGQGVQAGSVNELSPDVEWMPWQTLAQRYPGISQ